MTESIEERPVSGGLIDELPDELTVPEHVSDDPGRPEGVIEGQPGAMLIIISGPSGVGKDTIIDELKRRDAESDASDRRRYVVTCTTRERRNGEVDGVDYHFLTRGEFLRRRAARGFLEAMRDDGTAALSGPEGRR